MNKKNDDDADGPSLTSADLHTELAEAGSLTDYIDELNRQAYLRVLNRVGQPTGYRSSSNKLPHP